MAEVEPINRYNVRIKKVICKDLDVWANDHAAENMPSCRKIFDPV